VNAEQQKLRAWFEHEQNHPRQSIIQALDSLGLRDGDRVADIGCGPGVHLRQIARRVGPQGAVVGIDTSAERLEVAEAMLRDEVESGIVRLAKGDLHALDSGLGTFDLVWLSLVLHHEDIPADVVRELRHVVTPGGRIAILDGDESASLPLLPGPPEFELAVRQAATLAAADDDPEHGSPRKFGRRYTARSLPAILSDAGLADVQLRGYSDLWRGPLGEWELAELRRWFVEGFGGRIRAYLAPADWRRYEACFTPGEPECLLTRPDFFMVRTWYLGVGTVASAG
jgi:ubiquinone/menaquinone biosynthesis C-methylase UbiE